MAIVLLIRSSAWLDLQPLQIQGNILILGPNLNSEGNITERGRIRSLLRTTGRWGRISTFDI
jgi:hypothetical protein